MCQQNPAEIHLRTCVLPPVPIAIPGCVVKHHVTVKIFCLFVTGERISPSGQDDPTRTETHQSHGGFLHKLAEKIPGTT